MIRRSKCPESLLYGRQGKVPLQRLHATAVAAQNAIALAGVKPSQKTGVAPDLEGSGASRGQTVNRTTTTWLLGNRPWAIRTKRLVNGRYRAT
jgi:hypothetical protein